MCATHSHGPDVTQGQFLRVKLVQIQFSFKIGMPLEKEGRTHKWCTLMDPHTKAGRPARTYIQQLCEDQPRAINDREKWRERVRDIRATSTTWLIIASRRTDDLMDFPTVLDTQTALYSISTVVADSISHNDNRYAKRIHCHRINCMDYSMVCIFIHMYCIYFWIRKKKRLICSLLSKHKENCDEYIEFAQYMHAICSINYDNRMFFLILL